MSDNILSNALQFLAQQAVNAAEPVITEVHGLPHVVGNVRLVPQPRPVPLKVRTLGGIVDFLRHNKDGLDLGDLIVHITGPGSVDVLDGLDAELARNHYLHAEEPDASKAFTGWLNNYHSIESFIVSAQRLFRAGHGDLAALLSVVGNISQNDVRQVSDDGVTQEVVAKLGIVKVGAVALPNPCMLSPRRSFPEVVLDCVPFVVRVKRAEPLPMVGLFEADGDAWRVDATKKVGEFIREQWIAGNADSTETPFGILA